MQSTTYSKQKAIFGSHDEKTIAQFEDVLSRAVRGALMADGHLGYVMPIGGVMAYKDQVSPVGVGFDIACGNAAILTDLTVDNFNWKQLEDRADEIQNTISFGIGRSNRADDAPVDHELFYSDSWFALPGEGGYRDELKDKAREQLGTVGSGNHYVDVFADTSGRVWVGVHFGSRGLGHSIATGFLNLSQDRRWGERNPPEKEVLLDITTGMGYDYWRLMQLAGEYAYAGREWVARKVVELLGGKEVDLVHNHHNYAWKETHVAHYPEHDGATGYFDELVVVRKGATPAYPGLRGFVGGSMGDDSVILRGAFTDEGSHDTPWEELLLEENLMIGDFQERALFSTVHGAGRVMSRTEARGKIHRKTGRIVSPGKVSKTMMEEWLKDKKVILRGGGLDESPHAYRRLPDVLEAQMGTVEVLETLSPLIVVMAGENEFDPFKD